MRLVRIARLAPSQRVLKLREWAWDLTVSVSWKSSSDR
jgi:hypothetical protein